MPATYKVPAQPRALFTMPFADDGTKTLPPEETTQHGRATVPAGFPVETQLPLGQGGVAPNRLDFNGVLHMLSAFSFWQQSGGLFSHNPELNYAPPSLVVHAGNLWWCVKENGPATPAGAVLPGSDDAYWKDLLNALAEMGGTSAIGNPVGTIITYSALTPPDGYLVCAGQSFSATAYPRLYAVLGTTTLPDMRGLFVRGHDTRSSVDPDGGARALRSVQGDAIRNITASWSSKPPTGGNTASYPAPSGAAYNITSGTGASTNKGMGAEHIGFDASRQVPTAAENRPKNITLLYCIKHD